MNSCVEQSKGGSGMCARLGQVAANKRGRPHGVMGLYLQTRIVEFLRQAEQSYTQPPRRLNFAAADAEQPLAPERRKDVRAFAQSVAERFGPRVSIEHLGRGEAADGHEGCADADLQFDLDLGAFGLVGDV